MRRKTAFDKYVAESRKNPEFDEAYKKAKAELPKTITVAGLTLKRAKKDGSERERWEVRLGPIHITVFKHDAGDWESWWDSVRGEDYIGVDDFCGATMSAVVKPIVRRLRKLKKALEQVS